MYKVHSHSAQVRHENKSSREPMPTDLPLEHSKEVLGYSGSKPAEKWKENFKKRLLKRKISSQETGQTQSREMLRVKPMVEPMIEQLEHTPDRPTVRLDEASMSPILSQGTRRRHQRSSDNIKDALEDLFNNASAASNVHKPAPSRKRKSIELEVDVTDGLHTPNIKWPCRSLVLKQRDDSVESLNQDSADKSGYELKSILSTEKKMKRKLSDSARKVSFCEVVREHFSYSESKTMLKGKFECQKTRKKLLKTIKFDESSVIDKSSTVDPARVKGKRSRKETDDSKIKKDTNETGVETNALDDQRDVMLRTEISKKDTRVGIDRVRHKAADTTRTVSVTERTKALCNAVAETSSAEPTCNVIGNGPLTNHSSELDKDSVDGAKLTSNNIRKKTADKFGSEHGTKSASKMEMDKAAGIKDIEIVGNEKARKSDSVLDDKDVDIDDLFSQISPSSLKQMYNVANISGTNEVLIGEKQTTSSSKSSLAGNVSSKSLNKLCKRFLYPNKIGTRTVQDEKVFKFKESEVSTRKALLSPVSTIVSLKKNVDSDKFEEDKNSVEVAKISKKSDVVKRWKPEKVEAKLLDIKEINRNGSFTRKGIIDEKLKGRETRKTSELLNEKHEEQIAKAGTDLMAKMNLAIHSKDSQAEVEVNQQASVGFSLATGKTAQLSSVSVLKASKLLDDLDTLQEDNAGSKFEEPSFCKCTDETLEKEKINVVEMTGFQTASGKMFKLSTDSLQNASKLLIDDNMIAVDGKTHDMETDFNSFNVMKDKTDRFQCGKDILNEDENTDEPVIGVKGETGKKMEVSYARETCVEDDIEFSEWPEDNYAEEFEDMELNIEDLKCIQRQSEEQSDESYSSKNNNESEIFQKTQRSNAQKKTDTFKELNSDSAESDFVDKVKGNQYISAGRQNISNAIVKPGDIVNSLNNAVDATNLVNQTHFQGFSTASGTKIKLDSTSLDKAKHLLTDDNDNNDTSVIKSPEFIEQKPPELSVEDIFKMSKSKSPKDTYQSPVKHSKSKLSIIEELRKELCVAQSFETSLIPTIKTMHAKGDSLKNVPQGFRPFKPPRPKEAKNCVKPSRYPAATSEHAPQVVSEKGDCSGISKLVDDIIAEKQNVGGKGKISENVDDSVVDLKNTPTETLDSKEISNMFDEEMTLTQTEQDCTVNAPGLKSNSCEIEKAHIRLKVMHSYLDSDEKVRQFTNNSVDDTSSVADYANKTRTKSDIIDEMVTLSKSENFTNFPGFSAASGKQVTLSENALTHARKVLADDLNEEKVVEKINLLSDGGEKYLESGNTENQVRESVSLEVKELGIKSNVDDSNKLLDEFGKETMGIIKHKDSLSFSGFCFASGKNVAISEKALEQSKKLLDNVESEHGSNLVSAETDDDQKGTPEKHTTSQLHGLGNTNSASFSISAGNLLKDSETSHKSEKVILKGDFDKTKPETAASVVSIFAGFSTASGNSVRVSEEALEQDIGFMKVECQDKLSDSGKDPEIVGFSAAAEALNVSDKALKHAKGFLDDKCGNLEQVSEKDLSHDILNNGVKHAIFEEHISKSNTEEISMVPTFIGFNTAAGNVVKVSERPLKHAKEVFYGDFEEKHTVEGFSDSKTEVGEANKLLAFAGFKTASGNSVKVSDKALETAKGVLNDDNGITELGEKLTISNTKVARTTCVGFSSASGKLVNVSDMALTIAKGVLNVNSDTPEAHETLNLQSNKEERNLSEFVGFSTASGHLVNVTDKAINHAKGFLHDTLEESTQLEANPVETGKAPRFDGFSTASGNMVHISRNALRHAKGLLDDEHKQPDLSDKLTDPISDNSREVPTFVGFSTAAGKLVNVSDKALRHAKGVFVDNFEKADQSETKPEVPSTVPVFKGFSTASGSLVNVSDKALKHALGVLGDGFEEARLQEKLSETKLVVASTVPVFKSFSTASGNLVNVSDKALKHAQGVLGDGVEGSESEQTEFPKMSHSNNPKTIKVPTFEGFSTASGHMVNVSDKALKHAKGFLGDEFECLESEQAEEMSHSNTEQTVVPTSAGFTTASGSKVDISLKALRQARSVLSEETSNTKTTRENTAIVARTTMEPTERVIDMDTEEIILTKDAVFSGFNTASGNVVKVSGKALANVRDMLDGEIEFDNKVAAAREVNGLKADSDAVVPKVNAIQKNPHHFDESKIEKGFIGIQTVIKVPLNTNNEYIKEMNTPASGMSGSKNIRNGFLSGTMAELTRTVDNEQMAIKRQKLDSNSEAPLYPSGKTILS